MNVKPAREKTVKTKKEKIKKQSTSSETHGVTIDVAILCKKGKLETYIKCFQACHNKTTCKKNSDSQNQ